MKEVKLTKGLVALVDDEDFEEINKHNWTVHQGSSYAKRYCGSGRKNKKSIFMHRQLLKAKKTE